LIILAIFLFLTSIYLLAKKKILRLEISQIKKINNNNIDLQTKTRFFLIKIVLKFCLYLVQTLYKFSLQFIEAKRKFVFD